MECFVDVLLPLALSQVFTYALPRELAGRVSVGCRVLVPFRSHRCYAGLVVGLSDSAPAQVGNVRPIMQLIDSKPLVTAADIEFWKWIAHYYMCPMGDVMRAALPAGLKLEGEMRIKKVVDFTDFEALNPAQQALWNRLPENSAVELSELLSQETDQQLTLLVNSLLQSGAIEVEERLTRAFRPTTEQMVVLNKDLCAADKLAAVQQSLRTAPKQLLLLQTYLEKAEAKAALTLHNAEVLKEVPRAQLLADAGVKPNILAELVGKNILQTYRVERHRYATPTDGRAVPLPVLSPEQQKALAEVRECLASAKPCLLHGVTSSGKTSLYLHLIADSLTRGEQVLYLLPEIALTTQLMHRVGQHFGATMGVYHSRFPDRERAELWYRQRSENPCMLVMGARSALFLPFQKLGLIIIDEEHEPSYKQAEPAPRYHARDAALMLAHRLGAKVVMGTATPSVETYTHALSGKYGLVELNARYGGLDMPEVVVEDVKELKRRRQMPGLLSPRLQHDMQNALDRGEQVILYQNRRGYAPTLQCPSCGWTPHCERCDVALTLHRNHNAMECHYCGASYPLPAACPKCGETNLRDHGAGTEKVEDIVHKTFPNARVARLDLDTTRSRKAYDDILSDFSAGKTNVLIGTQMVTKGLDFDRVSLVGVLQADLSLNMPDFRAYERTFQLLSQVAGRSGRKGKRGRVIIQTYQADLPLIDSIRRHNYAAMYKEQIEEREVFCYPPYCRLIGIYIRHRQEAIAERAAQTLAAWLKPHFGEQLLGPDRPAIARVKLLYSRKLLLKVSPSLPVTGVRQTLLAARQALLAKEGNTTVDVYFDVDPV